MVLAVLVTLCGLCVVVSVVLGSIVRLHCDCVVVGCVCVCILASVRGFFWRACVFFCACVRVYSDVRACVCGCA